MSPQQPSQTPLAALLAPYFLASLAYSILCGTLGRAYHPLAAFQVYVLGLVPFLVASLIGGRITRLWSWRRVWPPTGPETRAALSSVVILTASTLMYLSAQSMIAILVAQAGCLLLVARFSRPHTVALAALSVGAVALSVTGKPLSLAALPVCLGVAKTLGYLVKIRSVEGAKTGEGAAQAGGAAEGAGAAGQELVSPDDFLAAEQVLISLAALAVAALASHSVPPAPLTDWRLWAISASSLGMGLLGTRIMLRREELGVTFPAYRMASLVAAFGASVSRGELALEWAQWPRWSAALLACLVVAVAALSETQRDRLTGLVRRAFANFYRARAELAS